MRRAFVFAFLLLLLSSSALAQFPMPFQVIPVVGKAKGNAGTDWISDVSIANVGTTNGTIGVHYFPNGRANTFSGTFAKTMSLGAGKSVFVKDVIASWFPSFGNSTQGFLVIADISTPLNCDTGEPLSLIVSSRTYNNADPSKTYGQAVPSSLFGINFTDATSVITGVRHQFGTVPGYRSNAGVVNLSTVPILMHITTYRDDGTIAGNVQKTVNPLSSEQWGLNDLGVSSPLASGRIQFRMDSSSIKVDPCIQLDEGSEPACLNRCQTGCGGKYSFSRSGTFMAYLSKVDNGSSDAELFLADTNWLEWNAKCESSASSPLVNMMRRYGFGPPPSMTIRKVPRR